jgi:hypothetical protein
VVEEEGRILLPRYKRKKKSDISKPEEPEKNGKTEPEKPASELNDRLERIEKVLEQVVNIVLEKQQGVAIPVDPPVDVPPVEKEEKQEMDLVSLFYSKIGQTKIASAKQKKGEDCLAQLHKDGFDDDCIAYAIDWTIKNASQKLYDFNVIPHTIGDAMIDYEKKQKRETAQKKEMDKTTWVDQELSERQKFDEMAEKIDSYIADLSPEKYLEYAEMAMAKLKEQGANGEFISDIAISAGVRLIVRREIFGEEDVV